MADRTMNVDNDPGRAQYITPCCNYDTRKPTRERSWLKRLLLKFLGPIPEDNIDRARAVIMWNPFNQVVQCHNCGATFEQHYPEELADEEEERNER